VSSDISNHTPVGVKIQLRKNVDNIYAKLMKTVWIASALVLIAIVIPLQAWLGMLRDTGIWPEAGNYIDLIVPIVSLIVITISVVTIRYLMKLAEAMDDYIESE